MQITAERRNGAATVKRRAVKEEVKRAREARPTTGTVETKAVVFIVLEGETTCGSIRFGLGKGEVCGLEEEASDEER